MFLRFILVIAALLSCGCGRSGDLNDTSVKMLLESQPVALEAEQVSLTQTQFDCGVKEELWDPPIQVSQERSSSRLTAAGKALKFEDDVSIGEAGHKQPYVQVRGEFPVKVAEVVGITDGPSADTRLAQTKAGITIRHSCFTTPLPLLGVKRGKFSEVANPVFQFRGAKEDWRLDRLIH